jgi:hypothetical protein
VFNFDILYFDILLVLYKSREQALRANSGREVWNLPERLYLLEPLLEVSALPPEEYELVRVAKLKRMPDGLWKYCIEPL